MDTASSTNYCLQCTGARRHRHLMDHLHVEREHLLLLLQEAFLGQRHKTRSGESVIILPEDINQKPGSSQSNRLLCCDPVLGMTQQGNDAGRASRYQQTSISTSTLARRKHGFMRRSNINLDVAHVLVPTSFRRPDRKRISQEVAQRTTLSSSSRRPRVHQLAAFCIQAS